MTHDAVVVGSGPNGLVAANLLADEGWSVLVLESQPTLGGAVASDEEVHEGFVHDTFSAFYPLAAASPVVRGLGLEEHGLRWTHAPAVLGHPLPDGSWALLHRDRHVTASLLGEDGDAWLELCDLWDRIGDDLVGALLAPFPPVRRAVPLLPHLPLLLRSAVGLSRSRFRTEQARVLLAGNAGHADIPLQQPGSGLMALMLTLLGQTVGYPSPEGGAGRLADALARRLTSLGGDVRTSAEVASVTVEDGRARGVVLADGERIEARRAVLGDVAAPILFERLVPREALPRRIALGMKRFRWDPATVKVDWALSGPVPWASTPEHAPGTVHVGDSVEEMQATFAQVERGEVPDRPFMLAGQMTTTDPTRSPAGTEAMWAYTHVPHGTTRSPSEAERFADRMQARFEELAPGFGSRVLARRVLGPAELEARNASLVDGAVGGGTARLSQQLFLRPVPGLGRPETGIHGLYLASSSAHPGGGVHGACGSNAARAALLHDRGRHR